MIDDLIKKNTALTVECSVCKKLHLLDSYDYIVVVGNIYIGKHGGIVGNNLDNDGKVVNTTIFCKSKFWNKDYKTPTISCLEQYMQDLDRIEKEIAK